MTGSADYTVNPGAETDQGEVLSGGVPVTFDGFGAAATLALTGTGGGTVTVNGTAANDIFTVSNVAADEHGHDHGPGDCHGHGLAHGDAERLRGRRRVQRERQPDVHDAERQRRRRRTTTTPCR